MMDSFDLKMQRIHLLLDMLIFKAKWADIKEKESTAWK